LGLTLTVRAQGQPNYTVTDLGTQMNAFNASVTGINSAGQVSGFDVLPGNFGPSGFRTAADGTIDWSLDNIGTLGGSYVAAQSLNNLGQVVGMSTDAGGVQHAFRTAANSAINPATDDLGAFPGGPFSMALGVNDAGQAVGISYLADFTFHGFRTAANSPINQATDDLGTFGGSYSFAAAINASGQVVGDADTGPGGPNFHAFRTAAGSVGPLVAGNDLGTLGGGYSSAKSINTAGHVVGYSATTDPNTNIKHAFVYIDSTMYDLNNAIPAGSGWILTSALGINDGGQIIGLGILNNAVHYFRLDPVSTFNALVQPPIKSDGSSVFSGSRGVVPVKFTLTSNGVATCQLPPATISVTRTISGAAAAVDTSIYVEPADNASSFRISGCQYVYNLGASSLGAGTYRVDITINGSVAGSGVFSLR
jgi:probable HAF family extracellular repeat protein